MNEYEKQRDLRIAANKNKIANKKETKKVVKWFFHSSWRSTRLQKDIQEERNEEGKTRFIIPCDNSKGFYIRYNRWDVS